MNEVIEILKRVGAVLTNDHFVGTSGLHFDAYVNKDFLYPHTKETCLICKLYAEKYKDKNIEVVVGPALGGIILSQWVAYHLSDFSGKEVLGVYTEKSPENGQVFKRGYESYVKGKRVLIVEDNTVTGGSVMKVIDAVKNAGGEIIGVCVMVNRDTEKVNDKTLGVPFDSLAELPVVTYSAEECPLCKSGIPINKKVGHGKKFLEEQAKK
jgi:orotate phosphoribosyltransferase